MLSVILWLTLIPAAFANVIEDATKLAIPSNFDQCDNLKALYPESLHMPDVAFLDTASGSLTGFANFTTTDSFLRFIDEYVVASLQSNELRNTLQYHLRLDFAGIDDQIAELYFQISSN
jgi:hypothetical protein